MFVIECVHKLRMERGEFYRKFGKWVKDILDEHGVSMLEFARRSHTDRGHMSRMLRGKSSPNTIVLNTVESELQQPRVLIWGIAGRLGIDPDSLTPENEQTILDLYSKGVLKVVGDDNSLNS